MVVCDICNRSGFGSYVSPASMQKAVLENGFNPFHLGLVASVLETMGLPVNDYGSWKRTVAQSETNWNICASCMAKLEPYLHGIPQELKAKLKNDDILARAKAAQSLKPTLEKGLSSPEVAISLGRVGGPDSTETSVGGTRSSADYTSERSIREELVSLIKEHDSPRFVIFLIVSAVTIPVCCLFLVFAKPTNIIQILVTVIGLPLAIGGMITLFASPYTVRKHLLERFYARFPPETSEYYRAVRVLLGLWSTQKGISGIILMAHIPELQGVASLSVGRIVQQLINEEKAVSSLVALGPPARGVIMDTLTCQDATPVARRIATAALAELDRCHQSADTPRTEAAGDQQPKKPVDTVPVDTCDTNVNAPVGISQSAQVDEATSSPQPKAALSTGQPADRPHELVPRLARTRKKMRANDPTQNRPEEKVEFWTNIKSLSGPPICCILTTRRLLLVKPKLDPTPAPGVAEKVAKVVLYPLDFLTRPVRAAVFADEMLEARKNEERSASSVTQIRKLANMGRFDEIASSFDSEELMSASDARKRLVKIEGGVPSIYVRQPARSLTFIPEEVLPRIVEAVEKWTGEELIYEKPKWWQGGSEEWHFPQLGK